MNTCFLILGTPRSGTSLLANILNKLDIFMGYRFIPANEMNPTGFYQDLEFEGLFDNCINEYIPNYPYQLPENRYKELKKLIDHRESLNIDWGVKGSKLPYLLKDFIEYSKSKIKLIVTERCLNHSIASWDSWRVDSDESANKIITKSRKIIDLVINEFDLPILKINYDELLYYKEEKVKEICQYVNKDYNEKAVKIINPLLKRFG